MTTAKLLEAISKDDTTEVMCAKIDAIFEGIDLVKAALGEMWYLEQTTGEMMAGNDGERNKTASSYASHIMDALRFARADSARFLGFVEGLRKIHADSEREIALTKLEASFVHTTPTIEPLGEAIPMAREWPYRSK
ncbi:hypothetical protein LCGC14_0848040 [marine sediment metagenome]|uniref:Uncharacterized protein n=1 Tax=marine sediment metagenome TaxID=412755 RepID=A0A0F9SI86_9ZZZZ